jgi:hypothetical protein
MGIGAVAGCGVSGICRVLLRREEFARRRTLHGRWPRNAGGSRRDAPAAWTVVESYSLRADVKRSRVRPGPAVDKETENAGWMRPRPGDGVDSNRVSSERATCVRYWQVGARRGAGPSVEIFSKGGRVVCRVDPQPRCVQVLRALSGTGTSPGDAGGERGRPGGQGDDDHVACAMRRPRYSTFARNVRRCDFAIMLERNG